MRVRQFDMDGEVPQEPALERRHLQASVSGLTISEGESGTTAKGRLLLDLPSKRA